MDDSKKAELKRIYLDGLPGSFFNVAYAADKIQALYGSDARVSVYMQAATTALDVALDEINLIIKEEANPNG